MDKAEHERFVKQIHKFPLVPHLCSTPGDGTSKPVILEPKQLSVSLHEVGLSEDLFSGMWLKAAKLAADPSSISNAPGLSTSKMVASSTNPRKPHLVTFFKNSKMTCDCINSSTKSLCAHAIAVAEQQGTLQQLIAWYTNTNQDVNLWNLARSSGVQARRSIAGSVRDLAK